LTDVLEWQKKEDENTENIINGRTFSLRNEIKNYRSSMQLNNKLTLWNSFNQIIKCDNFKSGILHNSEAGTSKSVLKILSEDIKMSPHRNKYHSVKTEIADIHFKCKSQVNNYKCKYSSSYIKKNVEVSRVTKLTIEKKKIKEMFTDHLAMDTFGNESICKNFHTKLVEIKSNDRTKSEEPQCCKLNTEAFKDESELDEDKDKTK
jgi:hypothetical protein